jgi:predicted nucleic acid-binding protein
MAVTSWLIDKSALVRLAASPDADEWAQRIQRGLVRITTVTRLEVGYSVSNCARDCGSRRCRPCPSST